MAVAALRNILKEWQVLIGIETHAQIKSSRKLFSGSLAAVPDDVHNSHVSLFDAAYPGTLPRLNHYCVDLALRTALALNCDVQRKSSFDRKHYFYPDLPSGYQITQQYQPLARNGFLEIASNSSSTLKKVGIKQIQLEQDTAKSTFNPRTRTSNIDLNRAGTGLMEIVSQPDIQSPEEAAAYVRTLQAVLRAVGSSDGNMEQGSLRCDVNVSINRPGEPPGTRCEIKNLNSVKFMVAAIGHEVIRQHGILTAPKDPSMSESPRVKQETRGFDEHQFETYSLRAKEEAPDYRYMPDPNLGVLVLSESRIQSIAESLPELPPAIRLRLQEKYALPERDVDVLLSIDSGRDVGFDGRPGTGGAIAYFDALCQGANTRGETASRKRDPKVVSNWMTHELLGQLTARKESFKVTAITAGQLGELIDLVQDGTITGTSGKFLLRHMLANPSHRPPLEIATELQMLAVSSEQSSSTSSTDLASPDAYLNELVEGAFNALPSEVAALRAGREGVLNKVVGWVMKQSRGRVDANKVKALVKQKVVKDS
ncbi:Glutamyl-tRNA amidotransferase subunit B, mitochondrial [Pluteus cervinus]|uniref:Glutamyl-tRNA amidotransferase subunit B, mitochondrial n=1 Tax=Pluteus cervinus TaxID=181527 RepID=A0ACD3B310_9AGAR|nr:Glutamyl-tRNA amidotransferase subunit B, mitochondrial [Pluteus cervinus]